MYSFFQFALLKYILNCIIEEPSFWLSIERVNQFVRDKPDRLTYAGVVFWNRYNQSEYHHANTIRLNLHVE